jgi:hypothetical protein
MRRILLVLAVAIAAVAAAEETTAQTRPTGHCSMTVLLQATIRASDLGPFELSSAFGHKMVINK